MQVAVRDLARFSVVDSVAIAKVQAVSRAKSPNRVLYEPRKCRREFWVEGAGVNLIGNGSDDLGAATTRVTRGPVGVRDTAVLEDAGAVQKVMYERIDGDHGFAGFQPNWTFVPRANEQG